MLTLSSAVWALQSLASQDDGIRKTFAGFFERDARLENLHAGEEAAFENYVTALTIFSVFKPDQASGEVDPSSTAMNKAASAYETFEPVHKVFDHIEAYVKSDEPAK